MKVYSESMMMMMMISNYLTTKHANHNLETKLEQQPFVVFIIKFSDFKFEFEFESYKFELTTNKNYFLCVINKEEEQFFTLIDSNLSFGSPYYSTCFHQSIIMK